MRCAICGAQATQQDEISGTRFCDVHAGPLSALGGAECREGCDSSHPKAWSDHDVDMYSDALRIGGYLDMPVPVPVRYGERAA
jgi:hypothetical protein